MGEKKDLLISFCIALWTTILLFSMFYMPAIAAELTEEDTETVGNLFTKGWFAKAYVKGWYFTGAQEFHHVYHEAKVATSWGWTIVDATYDFVGQELGYYAAVTRYHDSAHFAGTVSKNYYKGDYYYEHGYGWPSDEIVDYAYTYIWVHFRRWGQDIYKTAKASVFAP